MQPMFLKMIRCVDNLFEQYLKMGSMSNAKKSSKQEDQRMKQSDDHRPPCLGTQNWHMIVW